MQPTGVAEKRESPQESSKRIKLNYGQAMWLDYIRRDLSTTGKSETNDCRDDGLRGMTSNPAIFRKGHRADSSLYDDMRWKSLASRKDS